MTRVILCIGLLMAGLASCGESEEIGTDLILNPASASRAKAEEIQRAVLAFEDTVFNFGVVSEGHVLSRTFSFVNEGPGVALIADVSSTCGCTVPKTWPRTPLAPGDRGTIDVTFDTHGKTGEQGKVVSVVANTTPGVMRLHLQGTVLSPAGK